MDHLRLDDGVAAIERGLALLVPPMAAAAFAALKLLTQFGNLRAETHKLTILTFRNVQESAVAVVMCD